MIELSNNPASIDQKIPADRLFNTDAIEQYQISDVTWKMTIKPGIRNVSAFIQGRIRMEEIDVFVIQVHSIPEKQGYYGLLRQLHRKVMYPCVVFLQHENKYKIAAWNFVDAVNNSTGVVLKSPYITSWIRDPACSVKTQRCTDKVSNLLLNGEGNIKELYEQICSAILDCPARYVSSKNQLRRIIYDLTGKKASSIENRIDCTRFYTIKDGQQKYQKREYTDIYRYGYEYEDIWYAFINDEQMSRILKGRRYRDAEDMIISIDAKDW